MDCELKNLQLNVSQLATLSDVHRQTIAVCIKNDRHRSWRECSVEGETATDVAVVSIAG
jgi:post-segregation antitoxin (ccd killing protein)